MTRKTATFQLTDADSRKLAELEAAGFGTKTDIFRQALDRMHKEEMYTMTIYIVSHYWQNPKHNTAHTFTNLEEAQKEFMKMSSDEEITGESVLEIEGDPHSQKTRKWNKQRATHVSGRFTRKTTE